MSIVCVCVCVSHKDFSHVAQGATFSLSGRGGQSNLTGTLKHGDRRKIALTHIHSPTSKLRLPQRTTLS